MKSRPYLPRVPHLRGDPPQQANALSHLAKLSNYLNSMAGNVMKLLKKSPLLVTVFTIQLICVLYFIIHLLMDMNKLSHHPGEHMYHLIDYVMGFALIVSFGTTCHQIHRMIKRYYNVERQLNIVSREFADITNQFFEEWGLTSSESDVALLAIKGLEISEVAELRQTKQGTIKAQLNSIYRKAGVSGRPQLISLFVDELINKAWSDKFQTE